MKYQTFTVTIGDTREEQSHNNAGNLYECILDSIGYPAPEKVFVEVKSREEAVLMGSENHHGWKLEDLLTTLVEEIEGKCTKIDNDPRANVVLQNNLRIIDHLSKAYECQVDSMRYLESIGPNQGPAGKPRVGIGSES